jgi:hypothetical protein
MWHPQRRRSAYADELVSNDDDVDSGAADKERAKEEKKRARKELLEAKKREQYLQDQDWSYFARLFHSDVKIGGTTGGLAGMPRYDVPLFTEAQLRSLKRREASVRRMEIHRDEDSKRKYLVLKPLDNAGEMVYDVNSPDAAAQKVFRGILEQLISMGKIDNEEANRTRIDIEVIEKLPGQGQYDNVAHTYRVWWETIPEEKRSDFARKYGMGRVLQTMPVGDPRRIEMLQPELLVKKGEMPVQDWLQDDMDEHKLEEELHGNGASRGKKGKKGKAKKTASSSSSSSVPSSSLLPSSTAAPSSSSDAPSSSSLPSSSSSA